MKLESNCQIKVSVIIPVYNTEEYVREAVDSVRRQTLRELQIIVVNDGSTDGSLRVLEELAKLDDRIILQSQKNAGQSVARNIAMQQASGKYLYFMDSDDVIEPETLEACYRKCEEEALDFVLFDAGILNKESKFAGSFNYDRSACIGENELLAGSVMLERQLQSRCYTPSPCLILVRADFLRKQKLTFFPGIIHEDQLFSALLYLHADRVMYIQQRFFKRRFREASTMTQRFSWRNINGYLTVTDELLRFGKQEANENQRHLIEVLLKQMLTDVVWNSYVLPVKQRFALIYLCFRKRYNRYVSSRTMAVMLTKAMFAS